MRKIFDSYENIVAYTDGASIGNPGESGAGVVFFIQDVEKVEREEEDHDDLDYLDDEFRDILNHDLNQKLKHSSLKVTLTYLFSAQIYLGKSTNNQAEYVGLLLAQLLFALNEKH